jgi:hypothetical protein
MAVIKLELALFSNVFIRINININTAVNLKCVHQMLSKHVQNTFNSVTSTGSINGKTSN